MRTSPKPPAIFSCYLYEASFWLFWFFFDKYSLSFSNRSLIALILFPLDNFVDEVDDEVEGLVRWMEDMWGGRIPSPLPALGLIPTVWERFMQNVVWGFRIVLCCVSKQQRSWNWFEFLSFCSFDFCYHENLFFSRNIFFLKQKTCSHLNLGLAIYVAILAKHFFPRDFFPSPNLMFLFSEI